MFFLLGLLDISTIYINFIYFIIYISFFYNIYKNIKSKSIKNIKYICDIILKFIYLYLFWNLLSKIDLNFVAYALLEYFNIVLLQAVCIPKFDSLIKGWRPHLCTLPSPFSAYATQHLWGAWWDPLKGGGSEWVSATHSILKASFVNLAVIAQPHLCTSGEWDWGGRVGAASPAAPTQPAAPDAPEALAENLISKSEETRLHSDILRSNLPHFVDASGSDRVASLTKDVASPGPTSPLRAGEAVNDLISSKNLNLSIQKLFHAIGFEFSRYSSIKETEDSIKWEDLLYWLKTSSMLPKDEIDKLSLLLKNNDYNEFFKNIPRFLKYSQNMFSDYYVLNGNIYISEKDFYFYHGNQEELKIEFKIIPQTDADQKAASTTDIPKGSKFIWVTSSNKTDITNYSGNTSLTMFLNENFIPTIKESGVQMSNVAPFKTVDKVVYADTDISADDDAKKYIFFISISDLFDNDNKLKKEIDVKNDNLISKINLEKCNNFWQLDYFKQWFYVWFIELDIQSYLSLNILRKLNIPLMDITPDKLMYTMHLTVVEYLEELDILIKAKIWYEHHTGINYSSLSESTLNEYKNLFIKFWIRQIISYSKPGDIDSNYIITNMYDVKNVYSELLENILFVQSKILEAQWTINTIYIYLPSFIDSSCWHSVPRSKGVEGDYETNLINFYNKIFALLKKEVIDKYKDVYEIRRAYQVDRFNNNFPMSCEDLQSVFNFINNRYYIKNNLNTEFLSNLKNFKQQ